MKCFFCLLSKEEANDPTKIGYAYALTKKKDWIQNDDTENYLTGALKGVDFMVHDGKVYMFLKRYVDLKNNEQLVVCTESKFGCDTKQF